MRENPVLRLRSRTRQAGSPAATQRQRVGCPIVSFAPGPPLTDTAVRIVLLGSGELGP